MSGTYKGRREDFRLLTGQGKYTSDWNRSDQLYGHFLRSDRAHAEIVSLNVKPALERPGVVAVLTGADTAKAGLAEDLMFADCCTDLGEGYAQDSECCRQFGLA